MILATYALFASGRSARWFHWANAIGCIPIISTEIVAGAWPPLVLTRRLWRDRLGGRDRQGDAVRRRGSAVDEDAETVARIVHLWDDRGLSLHQIIDVLESESRSPRRGKRWQPEAVGRVLRDAGVPQDRRAS